PNFSLPTQPAGVVAVYVNPATTLTISGTIAEALPPTPANGQADTGTAPASGLAEVGTGTLVLNPTDSFGNPASNTYSGGTYVGYTFGAANSSGASPAGMPGGTITVQNQ